MQAQAQLRLGTPFNASDYRTTLDGLCGMEWSLVPIEPPQYLVSRKPEVFGQEQARVLTKVEHGGAGARLSTIRPAGVVTRMRRPSVRFPAITR